jgi:hypothetical protein
MRYTIWPLDGFTRVRQVGKHARIVGSVVQPG